jgi:copper homeostasis protein
MIRPRTGSFVYSEDELLTMAADILAFKEEGIKGFVFGCLTRAGEVDVSACKRCGWRKLS